LSNLASQVMLKKIIKQLDFFKVKTLTKKAAGMYAGIKKMLSGGY